MRYSWDLLRALNRHVVRVFNPDRKGTHWGKPKRYAQARSRFALRTSNARARFSRRVKMPPEVLDGPAGVGSSAAAKPSWPIVSERRRKEIGILI
jgi:hypothetical protein